MVQDQTKSRSYGSNQPEKSSSASTFGNIQKMKMASTNSAFGSTKKDDQSSKSSGNNSAVWGPHFKNRDHFVSMHFS
uniref:Uncharacterized protein n=1 Tax=Psorophora albipes TaxID=869069 RepID=T1DG02_9DIPT